jgi:AAA domain
MAKDKDINDILRDEGEEAAREYHDSAEPFNESNPKFQNGDANGHDDGHDHAADGDGTGAIHDLGERDAGDDIELPKPRQWVLGNQFCRKFLSGLIAPGGTGKSALRLAQGLSLVTKRSLTGEHVFKRCRVLIVSLEDDAEEMQRHIRAALIHHNIPLDEIAGRLFYATPKGMKLAEMRGGSRQIGMLEKSLRAAIERRQPDLVILDPYVKLHALEENDNGAMDFVSDLLATLAIEYNIAVDAPHHSKKGQLTPGDPDSGHGASAIRDAGRLVHTLTAMSEDEAKRFGISPEERTRYVRLDKAKVNLAPPSRTAIWFKLVGVRLGNGDADYPNGDEVQTVEPWTPPKTWDGLSSETLNAVLTDIAAGLPNGQRYSGAGSARKRAAWTVVQKHCSDRTEGQCREIIRTWVKNGVLVEEDYSDPVDRKVRQGLRLDTTRRPS